ncbi:hypothetical protein [Haloarchaeobius baliensis]
MTRVETEEENDDDREPTRHDAHLRDVDPGAGCTEIWEHLSEERDEE